jgi:hypothetical protein
MKVDTYLEIEAERIYYVKKCMKFREYLDEIIESNILDGEVIEEGFMYLALEEIKSKLQEKANEY